MKVVLFCGGLGMRLREHSEQLPKPMVAIGYRPLLWHVMRYYAHFGHKDFILCLGHRADVVKDYFLKYDECLSNDFVLVNGREVHLTRGDIQDWRITFVDTGLASNVGQRLKAVEGYLEGEEAFLANYSDGLTDLPLPEYVDHFLKSRRTASCLCVRPNQTFHLVSLQGETARGIEQISRADLWMNGGFFIFRPEIFDYIGPGEELVNEPFQRLIAAEQLMGYKYEGFWACMDTFKDKQALEDMDARGEAPWEVWKSAAAAGRVPTPVGGPSVLGDVRRRARARNQRQVGNA
jgi:glucose-1-phosphate cytidylyltransferase